MSWPLVELLAVARELVMDAAKDQQTRPGTATEELTFPVPLHDRKKITFQRFRVGDIELTFSLNIIKNGRGPHET